MVDRVSDRISDWLPEDLTSPAEINRAIADSGWSDEWNDALTRDVADFIAEDRDVNYPEIKRETREKTTVMGPQDNRHVTIKSVDNETVGKPDNVKTWEDRWGNVWGHNTNTGFRAMIKSKEDRE